MSSPISHSPHAATSSAVAFTFTQNTKSRTLRRRGLNSQAAARGVRVTTLVAAAVAAAIFVSGAADAQLTSLFHELPEQLSPRLRVLEVSGASAESEADEDDDEAAAAVATTTIAAAVATAAILADPLRTEPMWLRSGEQLLFTTFVMLVCLHLVYRQISRRHRRHRRRNDTKIGSSNLFFDRLKRFAFFRTAPTFN